MAHSSEKRWPEVSGSVSVINRKLLHSSVVNLEEFERVKEIYTYCDSDDTKFANLLFHNDKDAVAPDNATALEITMATELWDSVKMWEELGDFMNNGVVASKNRAKKLRNVS